MGAAGTKHLRPPYTPPCIDSSWSELQPVRITSVRLGEQGPEEGVGVGAGACRLRPAGGETVAILLNISYFV